MIIHKYVIEPQARFFLNLPVNSHILSVQNQREKLCAWARIDDPTCLDKKTHVLRIIMTGDENTQTANLRFIDTVQMAQGSLVLHVFEEL